MASKEATWKPSCWVASCSTGSLEVIPDPEGIPVDVADADGCRVVFEGVLFEIDELRSELGEARDLTSASACVLHAYLRWGAAAFDRLSGLFSAVVADGRSRQVLAARDPLGAYPLFYAKGGTRLELSISIGALLRRPEIPNSLNLMALADHLSHRWPDVQETYFEAVSRVPAGSLLVLDSDNQLRFQRYWDPSPPGRPVEWVTESELERFDELLEQAVRRRVELGPVGIYLSGGLDSVTVAAVASEMCKRLDQPPPKALSLVFEHDSANEETLQRQVGAALSLPHTVAPMSETLGGAGLLRSALRISAQRDAPLLSLWEPAYEYLAEQGRESGCRAVLTGSGGDEWLNFNPVYSADLIRRGRLRLLYETWGMMHRSYRLSRGAAARHVLWTFGVRRIIRGIGALAINRFAPRLSAAHRRRWIQSNTPAWVLPDPTLRRRLLERHVRLRRGAPRGSHYLREVRRALDSPVVATELEEMFERGRRTGLRVLHPFLDADLAAFLYVTPPELLMRGGRSKGLIRSYLARRFPSLGFEHQRKLNANQVFTTTLLDEGRPLWEELGGAKALAAMGVVDPAALERVMQRLFDGHDPREAFRIWYVLSLETWTRTRLGERGVVA